MQYIQIRTRGQLSQEPESKRKQNKRHSVRKERQKRKEEMNEGREKETER